MSNAALERFEVYLRANLPKAPSFHPHYETALGAMLLCGGKRFRPALLLSIVEAYSPSLLQNAFSAALALECLHTYSLIHDDLPCMDNADLRRGEPTLHVRYDEVTAVLAGDALNTHAFYLLSTAPLSCEVRCELVELLAKNGGAEGMVLGQAIDCHFEEKKLSEKELEFLHLHKTGKLIAASLAMGGVIAILDRQTKERLFGLGLNIGLFFQIRDDLLDDVGTRESCGKPVHADGHKNSFVTLLGQDGARERLAQLKECISSDLASFNDRLQNTLGAVLRPYLQERL